MASVIHATAHGLVAGSAFMFSNVLPTDCGIDPTVTYYVLAAGLTANDFEFSTSPGGTPFVLDLPITGGDLIGPDTYTPITDGIQDAPTVPPTPASVTLTSLIVSGITRLRVTLNDTAEVKVRLWEVQLTHKFNDEQAIAGTATGVAATDIVTLTAHGLVANDKVRFKELTGGAGITLNDVDYFVISTGLTANAFKFSLTQGGAAFDFTTDITAATITKVIPATTDWAKPQTVSMPENSTELSIPCLPNTQYAARVRSVDVFGNFSSFSAEATVVTVDGNDALAAAQADLANDIQDFIVTETKIAPGAVSTPKLQANSVTAQILAATIVLASLIQTPNTTTMGAAGTLTGANSTDTFTLSNHGLAVNDRIRFLALTGGAGLTANTVDYFVISSGLTTSAFKVSTSVGGSAVNFTTDVTAGTVGKVIRRVEIDGAGIRLLDVDDSIIINIPTNGDPVYVSGAIDAGSFISETSAEFRGVASLAGSAIMTLTNGVAPPSAAPTLTASVDALTLTSTPAQIGSGIGYDSGAGTFWVAQDPTQSSHLVASEYNASTGAFIRSIPATGSITTITATLGSTSHVSDTAQATSGSSDSQVATPLTMPTGLTNMHITKVSIYATGYGGTCSTKCAIWNPSSTRLAESAAFTMPSESLATGASNHYDQALTSPLAVSAGQSIRAGFLRTSSGDGFQWDRDDGSSKTTYRGDGLDGNMTGVSTDTTHKPNVYVTYTYDVDTRLETAKNIAVCTDGTYIYTLDANGVVWKYDRSTLAHVAHSAVQTAITGTKSQAGMFYDATAVELIITTTTGTGTGVFPKCVRVTPSTLAVSSTVYSAAAGPTFDGTNDTFRGGARLNDPLNASTATYWLSTTSAVYAYTFSGTTLTNTANRDFGLATTVGDGLTHDGSVFRGYDTATPTKVWKFSGWDWTTTSAKLFIGYAWYDSNATGGTHETTIGPRASLTIRRRERVQVQNASIPVGGTDDPNNVRIYALQNATDTGPGTLWLQVTDALTSRYMTTYTGSGTHDGAGTAFPSGTPAQIASAATGWQFKGDGTGTLGLNVTGGKVGTVQVFTTTGANTYTKPAGLSHIIVECVGGGGSSGGVGATGAGQVAVSGAGGGGGYSRKLFTAAQLTQATYTATVGAGGAAPAAGANNGNAGAASTFAGTGITTVSAGGGGAGSGAAAAVNGVVAAGAGGTASGGDLNVTGGDGSVGTWKGGDFPLPSGLGGNSGGGWGGTTQMAVSIVSGGVGNAGGGYGGGASGSTNGVSQAARAGAAGAAGIVIVTEFYVG